MKDCAAHVVMQLSPSTPHSGSEAAKSGLQCGVRAADLGWNRACQLSVCNVAGSVPTGAADLLCSSPGRHQAVQGQLRQGDSRVHGCVRVHQADAAVLKAGHDQAILQHLHCLWSRMVAAKGAEDVLDAQEVHLQPLCTSDCTL